MADIYVRSTDGNDADNGSTWALAKATIAGALAIAAGGDTIYVSQAHSESAAGITWTSLATFPATVRIIAADDGAQPPTAEAASKIAITTTGNSGFFTITGPLYVRGFNFTIGSGATSRTTFVFNGVYCSAFLENCDITFAGTGNNNGIDMNTGNSVPQALILRNVRLKFAATSDRILTNGRFNWRGGSIISGSATPTRLVASQNDVSGSRYYTVATLEDLDLSNLGSSFDIFDPDQIAQGLIRYCKLPSGWSGNLIQSGSAFSAMERLELHNCDSGDTNYRLWVENLFGSIKHETTLVKTGGASDGTTPLSWKLTRNSDANYPLPSLASPEIVRWNETIGSSITVTVDFLHDSVTALQDKDIWLEVAYLGTSGFPFGTVASSGQSNILASGSNCASSSATWTTTGMSNPNKQKMSVSFTPQEIGFIVATIRLAKASYTVYIDPLLQSTGSPSDGKQYQIPGYAYLNGVSSGAAGGGPVFGGMVVR